VSRDGAAGLGYKDQNETVDGSFLGSREDPIGRVSWGDEVQGGVQMRCLISTYTAGWLLFRVSQKKQKPNRG